MLLVHNGNKLEIKDRKISGKPQSIWMLNNIILNNKWSKNSQNEILKYFELKIPVISYWEAVKTVLIRKFIVSDA